MEEKNITNICIESKRGNRKENKKMVKISATSFLFPAGTASLIFTTTSTLARGWSQPLTPI